MKNLLPKNLKVFSGVFSFIIILIVSNYFWKYFVLGDESGVSVTFFGFDISRPFVYLSHQIAVSTHQILNFIGYDTSLTPNNVVRHSISGSSVCVVWSCSGIKQAYIYFCIIAFFSGPWKHKLWYIPMGLIFVYLFNLFRIVFITAIIDKHPEQFDFWHEYVMKYAFYGMIFLLWVAWNELFILKKPQSKDRGLTT